jgi:malate dehydrogenase (oxaloacetate-decarboxylating)
MGDIGQEALDKHRELHGKIEITAKGRIQSARDLNIYYTPGVGTVASYLAEHPNELREMTLKRNTVAVISDGSAVLGLGNIGPAGALPVMEGKAMLFKELADIDAFPIVLDTQDVNEVVSTVSHIATVFGGINLEDFAAPKCFEIETLLKQRLDIPVMHDDQHGTAIVVTAGLINAFKVVNKQFDRTARLVVVGSGAAGSAVARLISRYSGAEVIMVDSKGIVSPNRTDLDSNKQSLLEVTNPHGLSGSLEEALRGADAVIGVSKANLLTPEHIQSMAKDAIVFGLSNPIPEIMPDIAKSAGAAVVATGRSDFPNQVNNALAFPGVFRGALDNNVRQITDDMKTAAAVAIASLVSNPTADEIIPAVLDPRVVPAVAAVIKE